MHGYAWTLFFIRIYSIRMLKMKSGKKLRMSEEYAHLEVLLLKNFLEKSFVILYIFVCVIR